MSTIKDEVEVSTNAAKAYAALTTQAGYRAWWNAAGEVAEKVGGEAKLRFVKDGQPVNMQFRIDEQKTNERVRWTCIGHDIPMWVGTTLTWNIKTGGRGCLISLDHDGWKDATPVPVAEGWKYFLGSLKAYLETGTGQPW